MRTSAANLLAVLLAVPLAACVAPQEGENARSPKDLPPLAGEKGQPLLALADHLLGNYFTSDVARQPTVCLAVNDGRDDAALPPQDERALMMRHVRLSPLSRCALADRGWVDSDTDEAALVFTLHSFTCADADHCTGFGSFTAGQQNALSSRYSMAWDGDAWRFARDDRLLGTQ
jgi:hypothetical protein